MNCCINRKIFASTALLLVGLGVGLGASRVEAFTLSSSSNSSLSGWANYEIQFAVNTTNCPSNVDLNSVVDDAIKVWNNVPNSKLKLSRGAASSGRTYSDPPVIWCSTNFASDSGSGDASSVVGTGLTGTIGNTIVSGHIVLNAQVGTGSYIGNMNSTTLKIIVAHEMGHVLGLGHSSSSSALMYYSASSKTDLALNQDDMDGIAYLYPRNETSSDKIMGCGLVAGAGTMPKGSSQSHFQSQSRAQVMTLLLGLLLPLLLLGSLRSFSLFKQPGRRPN